MTSNNVWLQVNTTQIMCDTDSLGDKRTYYEIILFLNLSFE